MTYFLSSAKFRQLSYSLSLAGNWIPVNPSNLSNGYSGGLSDVLIKNVKLGNSTTDSLVLVGWSGNGLQNGVFVWPSVNLAIYSQLSNGLMANTSASYLSNTSTNGGNSIVTGDFNHDGFSDILIPSYSETPWDDRQSILFLSNGPTSFIRSAVGTPVIAHDSIVYAIEDTTYLYLRNYSSNPTLNIASFTFDPISSNFLVSQNQNLSSIYGGSIAIASNLDSTGSQYMLIGDAGMPIEIFKLTNGVLANTSVIKELPSYFYGNTSYMVNPSTFGNGRGHVYRIWTDDFNHDGLNDILAGVSLNNQTDSLKGTPNILQMLQNSGGMEFSDATDVLNPLFPRYSDEIDYQMQIVDIDHSGINSYLSGAEGNMSGDKQSNYLLLNDGTGHLYIAMHDEFRSIASNIVQYLNANNPALGSYINQSNLYTPLFHSYLNSLGNLDFVAIFQLPVLTNGIWVYEKAVINVPLNVNISKDFNQDIAITNRNNSMLMRTWAGNDIFYDTNANIGPAHIDGGLGFNIGIYSDSTTHYAFSSLGGESFEVRHVVNNASPNVDDTLVNITRLQFTDSMVGLDIGSGQTSGEVFRLYQAALNRAPDTTGLGYWIDAMDHGTSLTSMANAFIGSTEFTNLYGTHPSDTAFVVNLYANVLHRTPDPGGQNYWLGQLSHGETRAQVLAEFSESSENITNITPLIAQGVHYQLWVNLTPNTIYQVTASNIAIGGTSGVDTIAFNASSSHFNIALASGQATLTDQVGTAGTDSLSNVERLQFTDSMVGLDIGSGQTSGEVFRLYQAALNRAPDTTGLGYWIDAMDHGTSLTSMANAFIGSTEFTNLYGTHPSDTAFVVNLYANVLHRTPDPGGQNYWLGQLSHGETRAQVLAEFSESSENITNITPLIAQGVHYQLWH